MGNGAKVALVGVLAMIVLVVALWDRTNEKQHQDELKNLPVVPLERPEARVKVRPEAAAHDRVRGEITPGPLAANATAPRVSGSVVVATEVAPRTPSAARVPVPVPASAPSAASPALPASPPAAAAAPRKTYKIQPNDTLSSIAEAHYGNRRHWKKIADANKDVVPNPDRLPLGKDIVIPALETAGGVRTEAPGATTVRPSLSHTTEVSALPAGTGTTYTVKDGDNLYRLAERLLGDAEKWRLIFDANRDKLPTESSLRAGQQLMIPAGR